MQKQSIDFRVLSFLSLMVRRTERKSEEPLLREVLMFGVQWEVQVNLLLQMVVTLNHMIGIYSLH